MQNGVVTLGLYPMDIRGAYDMLRTALAHRKAIGRHAVLFLLMSMLFWLRSRQNGPVKKQINKEPEDKKECENTVAGAFRFKERAGEAAYLPIPGEMGYCDQQGGKYMQDQASQCRVLVRAQATDEITHRVVIGDPGKPDEYLPADNREQGRSIRSMGNTPRDCACH